MFLSFRIAAGAGKPIANVHKCCVVQWCGGKYHFFSFTFIFSTSFPLCLFFFLKKCQFCNRKKMPTKWEDFPWNYTVARRGRNAQYTEIHNRNNCIDKSSPECHIFRLLIVHYASASGLCLRKASHTSLSCMFMWHQVEMWNYFLYICHNSVAKTLNRQQRCYVF